MKHINQYGFAAIEAVLVVVILGIISGTGYFVWQAKQNTDKSLDAANNSKQATIKSKKTETKTTTQPTDESSSWLLYESPGKEFTIRLADGWQLERYQQSSSIYSFNNEFAVKTGTKAVVKEVEGGKDGRTGLFINYATQNLEQIVTPGTKQPSLKTIDGVEVEKYYWVVSGYGDQGAGIMNGDTEYVYVIKKGTDRAIVVNYSYQPAQTDYHEAVERVVKTAHFN